MRNGPIHSAFPLYAGVAIGVDFIATPAKFLAPHLNLPVALEVGRATFHAFNKAEWAAIVLLALWSVRARPGARWYAVLAGTAAIVLIESIGLLPILDARVEMIFVGATPPPSSTHAVFIGLEVLKIACLMSSCLAVPASLEARVRKAAEILRGRVAAPYPAEE